MRHGPRSFASPDGICRNNGYGDYPARFQGWLEESGEAPFLWVELEGFRPGLTLLRGSRVRQALRTPGPR